MDFDLSKMNNKVCEDISFKELILKRIKQDKNVLKAYALELRFIDFTAAIKYMINFSFNKAKQSFYTASLLDKLRIERFNNTMLDYDLSAVTYPLLSDNEDLIQEYSMLRYQAWGKMSGMDENIKLGKAPIWCNTIQNFMINDVEAVERNLNIIETITLKKLPKKEQLLKIDYEYYKALMAKDKSKCEELLEQLVSPKIHKKRNINKLHAKYISQPALGYAKLAWRLGIEVEVDSHLIPKEILPIEPLDKYEIPYSFLMNNEEETL